MGTVRTRMTSNRAACHLKLGQLRDALSDADAVVRLQPDWPKGHFRRGCALEQLGRLEEAKTAFAAAQDLEPDSWELRERLKQLRRRIDAQRQAQDHRTTKSQASQARSSAASRQASSGHGDAEEPTLPGGPDGWARGLGLAEQYEWLTDCYRMRVDDEMHYGVGLRGLYLPEATGQEVAEDFLVFCKLAVRRGAVPARGWNWRAFLRASARLLPYAFEKADAKEKWGGENVFAVMFGGRSLRAQAELIMGSSCLMGGMVGDGFERARRQEASQLCHQILGNLRGLLSDRDEMFSDVGGPAVWAELLAALGPAVAAAGHWG